MYYLLLLILYLYFIIKFLIFFIIFNFFVLFILCKNNALIKNAVSDNNDNSVNRFFILIFEATTKGTICVRMKREKAYVNPRISLICL